MATIPRTIAQRSLDTGNVVQYPSGSPVGAAISNLGGALQGVAERFKAIQDKKDAFDTTLRENEMGAALSALEQDAVKNAPADGSGIHDGVYGQIDPATNTAVKPGSFDALFDSYLERVPESKKAEFAAMRETYRLRGSNRLAVAQYGAQQDYYKVEIQKTQNGIIAGIMESDPNDMNTYETFKRNGLDIIEKSGLPALEKDVAKVNWEANSSEALYKTLLAKDPDFAAKAKAALGLAPVGETTGPQAVSSVVDRIIGVESGGNANAQNPRSSAGGLGQFIDSTWVSMVRKNRPDIARGMSNDQIIELKSDAGLAREMTTRLTEENAAGLKASGFEPTERNIYLAHFAGLSGAKQILGAADDTAISDVLSAGAVKANPQLAGKTVGDVKTWAARKMGKVDTGLGPAPNVQFIDATQGKIRDKPVQAWVKDGLARAAAATDSRIAIKIVSGGQDGAKRTGSTRHDHGNAADIVLVVDGKEVKPSEDKALYARFFKNAAASGFKGLGHYEWGIHVGGGAQAAWGPDRSSRTLDPEFAKAAAEGWDNPVTGGTRTQTDPRFASIPAERRLVLANEADKVIDERNKTVVASAKAEYTMYKDAIELDIVRGGIRDENLIVNDGVLNDGDKATLITKVRTQNEGANQISSDFSALSSGSLALDPYASKDQTRADNLYEEAIKRLPPEQHSAIAGALLNEYGIVPQRVVNTLRKGLASDNAADVMNAAQIAQRIVSVDQAALGRRGGGGEVQTAADDFTFYVNKMNLSPEEAAQRLIANRSPEAKFTRKAMEGAAKEFVKAVEKEDVAAIFDDAWLSDPVVGFSEGQRLGIQAEYVAIAEDAFYQANGDPDLAKNRAQEQMKALYGVTEMTGRKVVMKHPPEKYWPKFPVADAAQSLSYPAQLRDDIRAIAPNADMDSVQLVTTPETDAMVKRGEMPGYAVLYKDENGVLQTIPGKLWAPDISKLKAMQQNIDDAQQFDRLGKARANQVQERQKAPYNVQKPSDFLSGEDPLFGPR